MSPAHGNGRRRRYEPPVDMTLIKDNVDEFLAQRRAEKRAHIDHDPAGATAGAALVPQSSLEAIVAKRDAALRTMEGAIDQLVTGWAQASAAFNLRSDAAGGAVFTLRDRRRMDDYERLSPNGFDREGSLKIFREELDACVWQGLFERTGMFDLMDHTAREDWRKALMNEVPEVTIDNVCATMETVCGDADMIFKRGIAKAFIALERRFRSHDGFKIGSRMIFTGAFSFWGSLTYGRTRDQITDVERVFAKLDGQAPDPRGLFDAIEADRRGSSLGGMQSVTESTYFRVKGFKNGNAHLWFTRDDLVENVNKLLAEYYGEVIPDAVPREGSAADLRTKAGLPSRNLQYYFTPAATAAKALEEFHVEKGDRILEPSAGTGHLCRPLIARGAVVEAIEISPERCLALRVVPGLRRVIQGNFLTMHPNPVYDAVVMNPPFSGTHWMEHVVHAFDFLRPGGRLLAILPASAEDGETAKHEEFRAWAKKIDARNYRRMFRDLPPESFAEAGTRINTVTLELRKDGGR